MAPANASGNADAAFGIRQFVVGTGGIGLTGFGTIRWTSEQRNQTTHGVLKFTLHASSYDYQFIPIAGQSYTDSGNTAVHGAPPVGGPETFTTIPVTDSTGEKPQSKLWRHAGTWWAVLPSAAVSPSGTWIWRLNPDDTWSNVRHISTKTDVQADAKSDGAVTHILLHGPSPELVSVQYNATGNTYEPWSSRPAATLVSLPGSEIATIDLDSTGRMWLATENGANLNVHYSDAPYTSFAGPVTLANNINGDDIGVVTALPNDTIGVLWSNQTTQRFGFKVHVDGQLATTWSADEVPASGSALPVGLGMADDHLNVKVASDGTLYAGVKTSYDTAGYPKIALLIRRPNGTWDPLYEVDQNGTRGIVLLNEQDDTVRLVYTSSEGFNDLVTKKSSTSSISFSPRSTLITDDVNDATSTKQNWTVEVPVMAASASTAYTAFITADATPVEGLHRRRLRRRRRHRPLGLPSLPGRLVHQPDSLPSRRLWGASGDLSVSADYDGDGSTDIAVFRNGQWYVKDSRPTRRSGARRETSPCPATTTETETPTSPSSETGSWYVQGQPATTRRSGARRETSPCPPTTTETETPTSPSSETGSGTSRASPLPADLGPGRRRPRPRRLRRRRRRRHRRLQKRALVRARTSLPSRRSGARQETSPSPVTTTQAATTDIAVFRDGHWYVQGQPPYPQIWGGVCDIPQPLPYALRTLIPRPGCTDG